MVNFIFFCWSYIKASKFLKQLAIWLLVFVIVPLLLSKTIINFSISKISDSGLFPQATTTLEKVSEVPFLDRATDAWLGGTITPTGAVVCVKNNNQVYINGTSIVLPYEKDPEVGAMEIYINLSDGTSEKLLYVGVNKSACGNFIIKQGATFASSTLIFRHPQEVPVMLNRTETGTLQAVATLQINPNRSTYEMRPLLSDEIIIILKVLGAWWIFVIALVESWSIARRIIIFP